MSGWIEERKDKRTDGRIEGQMDEELTTYSVHYPKGLITIISFHLKWQPFTETVSEKLR